MKSEGSMSTKTRRSYTEAFKDEAVRLVTIEPSVGSKITERWSWWCGWPIGARCMRTESMIGLLIFDATGST